jgi:hypothetical protein
MGKGSKHTKGPWYVKDRAGPGDITCEVCYGNDDECITDGVYEKADARLIAVAPDLLEACKSIAYNFTKQHIDSVCQDQTGTFLYNAIKRAEKGG